MDKRALNEAVRKLNCDRTTPKKVSEMIKEYWRLKLIQKANNK